MTLFLWMVFCVSAGRYAMLHGARFTGYVFVGLFLLTVSLAVLSSRDR